MSDDNPPPFAVDKTGSILLFPPQSLDLASDDFLVESLRGVWREIMGSEADEIDFMRFEERAGLNDED